MKEPTPAEIVDTILRFAERKDVNIRLEPWQRIFFEQMMTFKRHAAREIRKPRPRLQWLGPDHILVRSGQPVKEPVDYYKSAPWVSNRETLRRYITEWGTK